jgi:hypothetical protein
VEAIAIVVTTLTLSSHGAGAGAGAGCWWLWYCSGRNTSGPLLRLTDRRLQCVVK